MRLCVSTVIFSILVTPIFAQEHVELDTIVVTGKYVMGEKDSRSEAAQFALLTAKREAMEKIGIYLTSESTIENYQLTRDEINTYTAGLMQTTLIDEKLEVDGDLMVMFVTIQAVIDPHEFAENARALRGEKNMNEEILALRSDYEKLSYQLDSLKRINGSGKIEKDAGNSRKMKWKLFERTELLLQIISESKKPLPKLWRMKTLIEKWNVKVPDMEFVRGYAGIALYKHQKYRLAISALETGLRELVENRIKVRKSVGSEWKKHIDSQEKKFRHYLKMSKQYR